MKKIYNGLKITALSLIFSAAQLQAQFANGVIISNEGNFGQPNADVSYLDRETLQVTNDVYTTVNNENLGDVLQNIGFHDDKAYLVLNNSNKVVVVDRETFIKQAVVTQNIQLPRYIAFANEKFYVTNSATNSVSVYNTSNNSPVSTISVAGAPEEIEAIGDHIFAQIGWYASGNTISVIDTTTDNFLENIVLSEGGLNGIVSDDEYLYVLTTGSDFTHIYKINGETLDIVQDTRYTSVANAGKITIEDDILYFIGNGNYVYGLPTSLAGEPIEILSVTDNSWSTFYGFNVIENFVFSGDASGYVAPSQVTVYDLTTGEQQLQFNTEIGVNGFYPNFGNLSVNENVTSIPELKIYPNPVEDVAYMEGVEVAKIRIFDIHGKLIKATNFNGNALQLADLKTGLYIFVIETPNGTVTKKVLKK